jgi:transcriptional regulator with XRE-family HTH domain
VGSVGFRQRGLRRHGHKKRRLKPTLPVLENLNQMQRAARAGMNASKISLIETSTRNVTLSTLARVAYALNTRIKIEFVPVKAKKR